MTLPPQSEKSSLAFIEHALHNALTCYQNGQIEEAQEQYLAILKIQADHPEANYSLGMLALQRKKPGESLAYFEAALDTRPEHGPYWLAYIDALDQAGQSDTARQLLEMAQKAGLEGAAAESLAARLGIKPEIAGGTDSHELHISNNNIPVNDAAPADAVIGNLLSLYKQGKLPECEMLAHRILARFPHDGFSWKVLGAVLKQQERLDEAIAAMRQAAVLLPQDPEVLNNLGLTLKNVGLLAESESILRRALHLNPNFAEAHNNLGVTLIAQGKLRESEECFRQAMRFQPEYAEAYCNLGITLREQGRFSDAEVNFHYALKLRPSYAEAYNNLGNVYHAIGRLSEAETSLRKALELKPDFAIAYNNLGNVLQSQGYLEESEHCYHKALDLKPDYSEAYDGLLFVSNYHPDKTDQEIYQLYTEYDERFCLPHRKQLTPHTNNRDTSRRLKIGYVSSTFYKHPTFHFLEPLLAHHDTTRFEIYAFAEITREDPITARYKHLTHHWIPTSGLSDEQLAERIRSDGIDILIDLAGHTGRNRLGVFARKPAPVSLHWLDFGYTTGLSAIDYYFTDINSAPIGSEKLFSEKLWRLPAPAFAYRPSTGMGHVSPLPAKQHGYVTFGTLTRAIRINHRTIRVWAEILHRVEGSRLVIDSGNFKDPAMQETLKEKFHVQGIDKSRLVIGYHSPPWDVLREIDIGLDCFPHNSGTTLFESLFLGVPFITLAGRPGVGRLGSSVLEGVGHPEWIAHSENEYIEIALSLSSDLQALASIRSGLRKEMQDGRLMDERGFAKRVEDAYLRMFKQWCEKPLSIPSLVENSLPQTDELSSCIIDDTITLYNRGVDLQRQNRAKEAENQYIQALNSRHNFVEAYNNLGVIFQQEKKFSDAETCFLQALEIKPDYTDAYYNLANTYKVQQKFFEAEANYRKVIEILPNHANAHYNLGNIIQEQGRPEEAEICLRHALKLDPDHIKAFSTLLFTLNYHPDKSSEEIFQAYQEFNTRFCQRKHNVWSPHNNINAKNRRLKVGYVAPDYRKHPARYFLEPLLAYHNRRLVETYAYVELAKADGPTDLFHKYVDHWIPVAGLTDDLISETIRGHAIDILVDLAGHTAGNRLGVFARKPAPVSLHWLDFGYTTGLTAIDYYLTDHTAVPAGSERFFSEIPWHLETPALAYRPPSETGPVNDLPAKKKGYVTFGTLTRAVRINHRTIRVWSDILKRCEGSCFIINSDSFREPAMRETLADQFIVHGIKRERLEIGCHSPPWDILRGIDIMLDCFPHNSGTTLVESLYMGVPFVTLADRPSVGRLGSSILEGAGHPEWIAETEDEYILKAVSLAADLPKLASIRMRLREEMEHCPLMDEPAFARKVEIAYKEMFAKWCESQQSAVPQGDDIKVTAASLQVLLHEAEIGKNQKHTKARKKVKSGTPAKAMRTIPKPHPDQTAKLISLFHQGHYVEGELLARNLIKSFPQNGFAWKALGTILHQQGKPTEALSVLQQALALLNNDAELHNNIASIFDNQGRHGDAETEFRKALELNPRYVEAYSNLGNTLQKLGRYVESEFYYKKALELRENHSEVYCNLGNSLVKQDKLNEAENCFRRAIKLNPEFVEAYNNLGNTLERQGRYIESELNFKKMLELKPDSAEGYNNLGNVLKSHGRLHEAELSYRQALKLQPDYTLVYSNLLFLLNNHADKSSEEIFAEYMEFDNQFGLPLQTAYRPFTNSHDTNRRLRVGYVSPQFRKHSTRHFLEPLLAHHDKTLVEVYVYTDLFNEDEVSDRYKSYVDHWILSASLSDTALADRIRSDHIDILVDLAGHTGGNRLKVFAQKPAPVSLHWLDFGYTTGLTAIDYYLTDEVTVPAGSEDLFSETPWRIATPCLAYRPAEGMGEVTPLPALERGYVTFGTLTRALRINHRTIRVWSEILKRIEGSNLVIDSSNFKDIAIQEELANKFINQGIGRERLKIGFHSPPWDVLRGLDIGLDCFPHNSGTTLLETLYMGSPFVTLADRPCTGRLGSSILDGLGHPEWIAYSEEEYIELAVALASDLPKLANIRNGLRQEMESSPLMDEPTFARKVEIAYKKMFEKWCKSEQSVPPKEEKSEVIATFLQEILNEAEIRRQGGEFEEAKLQYQSVLAADPQHPEANYCMGCLLVVLQQPSAALPYFETALDVRPDHGPYWLAYIDAVHKAGQPESARQLLKMAIQAGLDGEEVRKLEVRLSDDSFTPPAKPFNESQHTTENTIEGSTQRHDGIQSETKLPPEETNRLLSLFHNGKYAECGVLARTLIELYPNDGFTWKALGTILKVQGLLDEAVSILKQALALSREDMEIYHALGDIFFVQGRFTEAEDIFRRSLELNPDAAESHYALANTLIELGNLEEAEANYRKALEFKPDYAEALGNLGNTLQRQGKILDSEMCYRRALEFNRDYAEAHFNLGNLLREQHRLTESQEQYQKALEIKQDYYKACSNLGIVFQMQGQLKEAENKYRKAIEIQPDFVEGHINLGACLKEQGLYRAAEMSYRNALSIKPDSALCYSNLGSVLKEHGQLSEAEKCLRRALELQPNYIEAYSNLLFLLNYQPDINAKDIYEEYRNFNTRFCLPLQTEWQPHTNNLSIERRLRIGYISPQFRLHSIRHFLEPLLAHHDKQHVEIFAYADISTEDAVTERYKSYADHWIVTIGLSDAALAERVRADNIDILVDLAGHTAHNRLRLFARRPAPVSLHWLDFGYTTGLTAIDYYLTDLATVPLESDGLFSETLLRIDTPCFAYRPTEDMGEISPLPAMARGYVCFGTLTRAVRINHRTIRVWSEILKRVEGSYLVIDSSNFRDTAMQDELAEKFISHGIDRERLVIGYHSPPWDVLRNLDVSLDCFPHNSGTTLLETLYMGVPFITLADRPSVGRLGCSILEGLGHPEWIAKTEEEYVGLAITLASDLNKLATIRRGLRQEMENSPLMDEPAFTRKVEAAYKKIFSQWSEGEQSFTPKRENEGGTDVSLLGGADVAVLENRFPTAALEAPIDKTKVSKPTQVTKKKSKRQRGTRQHTASPHPDETNNLISLYQQGNLVEAEAVVQSLIERFPQNSLAWKVLGAIRRQQGALNEALSAMEMAVAFMPKDYICLRNIAVLLCDLGRYTEAEGYCRRALTMNSVYADAHNTLSIALRSQEKFLEAERSCRKALKLKPDFPEAFVNLGLTLNEQRRFSEAETCYFKAFELKPGFAEAYCSLSFTLQATGRVAEAESACRQALELKPDYAAAYNSLGGILNEQGQYAEAEMAYRRALEIKPSYLEVLHNLGRTLYNQGNHTEAESCYRQVLKINPDNAEVHYNLGNTLADQGRHEEAEVSYQEALKIRPDFPEAYINLGNNFRAQGWIIEAERKYRDVLQMHPNYNNAYNNLGNILQEQGRLTESEVIFRSILKSNPDYADAFGNLLFLLNYHPDKIEGEIFQEYIRFDERFCLPLRVEWKLHTNSRATNRRLKIGYVSSQFCQHPIRNFLEPLLAFHNKDLVELYAYAELSKEDAATERYRSYMEHWIPTKGMSDADMAERIRTDGIDILVDLAGHTAQNRLLVFARKPAPVSLHWLDFGYTTGLTAIDYYLADDASVPSGSEWLFSETPWRLETPYFIYRPNEGMGEVNILPAIGRGYITFGCLSRAVRINHRTIRVWAEILKRVEGSHLAINSGNFKDPAMQKALANLFLAHGIDSERLEIGYNSPPWDVLRSMDIGLDCFPHNSGTTLLETLYMGIPFITLASRPSVGRLGCSILEGLGHPEWIAGSEKEYVEQAAALANDLPRLATLRANLRQEMQQSPLMDEPAFARKVEAAYREMFEKWCEEQQ